METPHWQLLPLLADELSKALELPELLLSVTYSLLPLLDSSTALLAPLDSLGVLPLLLLALP